MNIDVPLLDERVSRQQSPEQYTFPSLTRQRKREHFRNRHAARRSPYCMYFAFMVFGVISRAITQPFRSYACCAVRAAKEAHSRRDSAARQRTTTQINNNNNITRLHATRARPALQRNTILRSVSHNLLMLCPSPQAFRPRPAAT